MEVVDFVKEEAKRDIYGLTKPRMRGLIHAWSILPFICSGIVLFGVASSVSTRLAVAVYALSITSMLTASAVYHRLPVSQPTRVWLRRVDHAMIGVAVAGSYTPIVALVTDGVVRTALLAVLWAGAVGGLVLVLFKPDAPRWIRVALYVALGWAGIFIMPELLRHAGGTAFFFVVLGGLLYSAGGYVYARRKPDPLPETFGFHEVFHACVVAAVVCHFIAVANVVTRLG